MGKKLVLIDRTKGAVFSAMLGLLLGSSRTKTKKEKVMKKKAVAEVVSIRRQAALDAWVTRREKAQKRSDAARKAWKTRKASNSQQ